MKKNFLRIFLLMVIMVMMVACGKNETIKIVFLPNESNESLKESREEFAKVIEEATGKKAEIVTTTDYNIAIENIISGKAQIAYLGGEAILSASERSQDVQAVLTNTGESGTLDDALYYSLLAIREEDADQYKTDGDFDIKKIKDKTMAFVTNSSTSGFKVPGKIIAKEFGIEKVEDVLEPGKVFSKVIFGNSHPGTQVQLFKKDADVATFAIPKAVTIYELVSGEENQKGATYRVRQGAVAPFGEFAGHAFTVIKSIPVLNGAITFNVKTLKKDDQEKIKKALMSEKVTNNPHIFSDKKSKIRGLFLKENEKVGLIETNNKWYEKLREVK